MLDGLFALLEGVEAATNKKHSEGFRVLAGIFSVLMLGGLIYWIVTALS